MLWNVDWLNANSQRKYPLSTTATAQTATGDFTLPTDFLVDASITVPYAEGFNPMALYLRSVQVYAQGVSLEIGYEDDVVASVNIAANTHEANAAYRLVGAGDYSDLSGFVAVGTLDSLLLGGPGAHVFDLVGGRLEARTVIPALRGVSGIVVVDTLGRSEPVRGVIELRGGSNVGLTVDPGDNAIRIDGSPLAGLVDDCDCDDARVLAESPPVRFLQGVAPNNAGNIQLESLACIGFQGGPASVIVSDDCSEPCCGCDELAVIEQDLDLLNSQINLLQSHYSQLVASYQQLRSSLLASRTGAGGPCP